MYKTYENESECNDESYYVNDTMNNSNSDENILNRISSGVPIFNFNLSHTQKKKMWFLGKGEKFKT